MTLEKSSVRQNIIATAREESMAMEWTGMKFVQKNVFACLKYRSVKTIYMKALGNRMTSLKSLERDELSQLMNKQLKWIDEYSQMTYKVN